MRHLFSRGYRLAYNALAIATLGGVLYAGQRLLGDGAAFALNGGVKIGLSVCAVSGWIIMFSALGHYDLARFAGSAQWRGSANEDEDEALKTRGLHRYVRHPLYTGAFLALWGAAWTPLGMATAAYASTYLLIGSWFEERRLLAKYGDDYRNYKARVPAFVPWKGRAI